MAKKRNLQEEGTRLGGEILVLLPAATYLITINGRCLVHKASKQRTSAAAAGSWIIMEAKFCQDQKNAKKWQSYPGCLRSALVALRWFTGSVWLHLLPS